MAETVGGRIAVCFARVALEVTPSRRTDHIQNEPSIDKAVELWFAGQQCSHNLLLS